MNTTLYLIRHGEVKYPYDQQGRKLLYGPSDPLSELGKLQLRKLGIQLKNEGRMIDVLVISPYVRAQESAAILKEELTVPKIYTLDALRDVYPNSWEGYPYEEMVIETHGGDGYRYPRSPNHETLEHIATRARSAVKIIVNAYRDKKIGVVSHGDLLSALHWMLTHPYTAPLITDQYDDMKNNFFLQKGQAYECTINPSLQLVGEGRFITVQEVNQSLEEFRKTPEKQ